LQHIYQIKILHILQVNLVVEGFTASLAKELSTTKIRPNAICPGMIETDMTRPSFQKDSK
jgi:NAD(P)-dependent dehydrogenase (short-subunit alcohol dehydrogenase family)